MRRCDTPAGILGKTSCMIIPGLTNIMMLVSPGALHFNLAGMQQVTVIASSQFALHRAGYCINIYDIVMMTSSNHLHVSDLNTPIYVQLRACAQHRVKHGHYGHSAMH